MIVNKSLEGFTVINPGFQPGDIKAIKTTVREEIGLKIKTGCGRNRLKQEN